jgi:hypothetical protein
LSGRNGQTRSRSLVAAIAALFVLAGISAVNAQQPFATPDEAANALVGAARVSDKVALVKILGRAGAEIVSSGDEVDDAATRQRFVAAFDKKHRIAMDGDDKATLILGDEDYPFPIPMVRKDGVWRLDAAAGRREILYRRIGQNELSTIQTMLAFADAQNEYASKDRGNGTGVYAQRFFSKPGQKDGLYWPPETGSDESPLGDLFARASVEGYRSDQGRTPFHGYYFKILTKQGPNAPGGSMDYVVKGKMMGGFALVAYPYQYGNSGVMTFVVNHNGTVFEKDLGPSTLRNAERITAYDPDQTWRKVGD